CSTTSAGLSIATRPECGQPRRSRPACSPSSASSVPRTRAAASPTALTSLASSGPPHANHNRFIYFSYGLGTMFLPPIYECKPLKGITCLLSRLCRGTTLQTTENKDFTL